MRNRFRTSALSPLFVLSMAQSPVEARLNAILAPQSRQRPSRTITLLASTVAAVATIALASVQVSAGQTPATPQSPPALPAGSATANHAGVSQEGFNAAHLRLASEGQSNATQPSTQSQQNSSTDDTAKLRKKLDALQHQLAQQQHENAKLRQQLKDVLAQERARANAYRAIDAQVEAARRDLMRASGPIQKADDASAAQAAALEANLRALQAQQLFLQKRVQRADELSRVGAITNQDADLLKTEEAANRAQVEEAQAQIRALISKKVAAKDDTRVRSQAALMVSEAQLAQAEANLRVVQERLNAGTATTAEVALAEANIRRAQAEINQIKAQMAQEKTP